MHNYIFNASNKLFYNQYYNYHEKCYSYCTFGVNCQCLPMFFKTQTTIDRRQAEFTTHNHR